MTISMDTPPGTRVRFKQWQYMADEFGVSLTGNIKVPNAFTHSMRDLCGTEATIVAMDAKTVVIRDGEPGLLGQPWAYSPQMFELATVRAVPTHKQIAIMLRTKRAELNTLIKEHDHALTHSH